MLLVNFNKIEHDNHTRSGCRDEKWGLDGVGGTKRGEKARMRKSREKEIRKERSKGSIKYTHTDGSIWRKDIAQEKSMARA